MYLEEKECQEKAEKDERRRKVAEEKMRRAILREAEEKTLIETAKNLKVRQKSAILKAIILSRFIYCTARALVQIYKQEEFQIAGTKRRLCNERISSNP